MHRRCNLLSRKKRNKHSPFVVSPTSPFQRPIVSYFPRVGGQSKFRKSKFFKHNYFLTHIILLKILHDLVNAIAVERILQVLLRLVICDDFLYTGIFGNPAKKV